MGQEKMVHMKFPEELLARVDHAAAVWTLDEIHIGSHTRHTRSSIIREAVQSYLKIAFEDVISGEQKP